MKDDANSVQSHVVRGQLWTVKDVSEFLGVHEKTVYGWVNRGGLPCFRLGNRLRFDANDVLRWVSAKKEGSA